MMIATLDTIHGCSPQEINEMKARQGVNYLPDLYVEYLLVLGKEAGNLDVGSSCFYPTLLELKGSAVNLLEENEFPFLLPDDAFVFFMHQGYQFLYFLTKDKLEDPPVFYYIEDPDLRSLMPQRKHEHLSEFLTYFIVDVKGKEAQESFLEHWKSQLKS
ncbi:MAG: SMI1/KNR4 family protein [Chloroflexota bacterium]